MKFTRLNELIEDGKKLKGRWQLGANHEVQYRAEGRDEDIRVRGSLVAAEPGALVISVTEKQEDQKVTTQLWKLSGRWNADPKNRIVFEAERESGKNDALTFRGGWRVGEFQELLYTYEIRELKTRRKEIRLLVFQGEWELSEKNRLTYLIGGDSGSALRFRAAFETKSILAKKGEIRYQAGMEAAAKGRTRRILLFGKWKYSDKTGIFFEMEYEGGRRKAVRFGGNYSLTGDRAVTVALAGVRGKPLGLEVILTQDLFGADSGAFLRFRKSVEEARLEGGLRFGW